MVIRGEDGYSRRRYQAGAKELWNACKQYGHVVDAFIPDRRSKIGKSFGFVRFIKVFDAERLVNNLCTVWIGSHRLHANIARFQRPTGQDSSRNFSHNGEKQKDDKGNNGNFNSDAHVLKGVSHLNGDTTNTPSLVIGDDCVNQEDYSCCLNGKVKEFGSLSNLKVVLGNEGFNEIRIRYLGGMWVMLVFRSVDGNEKFKVNVGTNSLVSQLIETFSEFVVDGRVAWVEVEGILLKVWTDNTFKRIASKLGTLLSIDNSEEDCYHNKRMRIFTADMVNIFKSFKIIYQGKTFWVRAKEVPGWSLEFEEQLDEDSEPEDDIFGGVDKPNTDNSEEEFEDENVVLDTMFDDGSVKPSVVKNSSGNHGNKSEDPLDLYPLLYKKKREKNKDSNCSDVIIMGDFNEVRYYNERFGSNFNVKGANAFNLFNIQAGLEEIPLGGCSFTWCHKLGSKMSKLDQFLSSESLLKVDGFEKLIVETWSDTAACGQNEMLNMMYKLKNLKKKIRGRNSMRQSFKNSKIMLKSELADVELVIDKGNASEKVIYKRLEIVNSINELEKQQAMETAFLVCDSKGRGGSGKMFFHYGSIPKGYNSSFIALIPKILDAKMVKDFRPISLIGRLYKIIAKILANRLVTVLGDVINEIQLAFVADRQILDIPLHLTFWNVMDAGMFKGIVLNSSMDLSYMFFANDDVFVGQWCNSNIDTIIYALKCFERASGLRLNMSKSKIMGIAVNGDKVDQAAHRIGCGILEVPFTYLGSKKMKTLSIGGRLTLIKAVLGAMPIYHMSIFKAPLGVLKRMESIRCRFFNGAYLDSNKAVWRFITQKKSLWARVISAIHGTDGKIGTRTKSSYNSLWRVIVFEMEAVKDKGANLFSFMKKRLGDGVDTCFWKDTWNGELPFKLTYPRLYSLEVDKNISVADKLTHATLAGTFRREPRSGIKAVQLAKLEDLVFSSLIRGIGGLGS
nr:DIE2/ALG10 family [Tanacetum cinerariifolium]